MAFDPGRRSDLMRLKKAFEESERRLRPFRDEREFFVQQFAGSHFGQQESKIDRVPMNVIDQLVTVYTTSLVSDNPRVSVSAPRNPVALAKEAMRLEKATDQVLIDQGIEGKIKQWVQDAMFSIGIAYSGIKYAGTTDLEDGGDLVTVTEPFVARIDLDDFAFDVGANRWGEVAWAGHCERVPVESVVEAPDFDERAKREVKPMETGHRLSETNRVDELAFGRRRGSEYQPYTDVLTFWLRRENLIVKVPRSFERALVAFEYEGTDIGPYDMLNYGLVPNSIMPRSPVAGLVDLHELMNDLFRQSADQALRQKTIAAVTDDDDGQRITKAEDGEGIKVKNPNAVRELRFGGADPANLSMILQLREMFSQFAGNLDLLAGIAPQSATASQDRLLSQNASQRMQALQRDTVNFLESVIRKVMWYEWTDPVRERTISVEAPGKIVLSVPWNMDTRRGDFLDFNFQVDPYSMQHRSPNEKLNMMMQVFGSFIAPQVGMFAQQGVQINYRELLRKVAKLGNVPELEEIIQVAGVDAGTQPLVAGTGPEVAGKPAQTTREYIRRSEGRETETQGAIKQLMDAAMLNQVTQLSQQGSAA